MSLGRQFLGYARARVGIRPLLACTAFLTLIVARNALPHFPKAPSAQCAARAVFHHDQKPKFDHHGPQWGVPRAAFLPGQAAPESPQVALIPQLFSTLQSKGFRYNRPPPVS